MDEDEINRLEEELREKSIAIQRSQSLRAHGWAGMMATAMFTGLVTWAWIIWQGLERL